jgi:protein O-mannosyl-transferase
MRSATAIQPPARPVSRLLGILAGLLGLLVAGLGFGQGFVWDDWPLLVQNPALHAPSPWWQPFVQPFQGEADSAIGHYRPLSSVLARLGLALTPGSPLGIKLLVAGLHGVNAWLLWIVLRRALEQQQLARPAGWAFCGAALFAVAPLQLEALWWASSLSVPQHLLPLLLACLWSGSPFGSPKRPNGQPLLVGFCLLAALLSKDNSVVFPFLLLGAHVLLRTPRERFRPLLVASLAALLVWLGLRAYAFRSLDLGLGRAIVDADFSAARAVGLAVELALGGLGHALLPFWPELLRPVAPEMHLNPRWFHMGIGLLGLLALVASAQRRPGPWAQIILLGLGLHLLPIACFPELLGRYPLSDRQLYVPLALSAGLLAGFGAGLAARRPTMGRGVRGLLLGAVALSLYLDYQRIPVWQNDVALFRAATRTNPHSTFGWNALGRAALESYRGSKQAADLQLAQDAYQRTMDLALGAARQRLSDLGFALPVASAAGPADRELDWIASADLIEANLGLGWCLLYEAELDAYRDFAVPEALFERVVRAAPTEADAHAGLAIALYLQRDAPPPGPAAGAHPGSEQRWPASPSGSPESRGFRF